MSLPAGAGPLAAPDFPSPVRAWRVWRVVPSSDGYRLASVFKRSVWPSHEPFAAECLRRTVVSRILDRPHHAASGERCECGIYGADLDLVGECLSALARDGEGRQVVGEVSLWGTVVECARGFRASFAYPRRIYLPVEPEGRLREQLACGLAAYGVPIELLPVRCVEAIDELRRRETDLRPA